MAVYAVFVSNRHATPNPDRVERFPTVEDAKRALLERTRDQRSHTYYLTDGTGRARPTARFPRANRSGFLLVWMREHGVGAPDPATPHDEVWSVSLLWTVRRHAPSARR